MANLEASTGQLLLHKHKENVKITGDTMTGALTITPASGTLGLATNQNIRLSGTTPIIEFPLDDAANFSDTLNFAPYGINKDGVMVVHPSGTATNSRLVLSANSVPDTSLAQTFFFGSGFTGARASIWAFGSLRYGGPTSTSRDIGFYISNSSGRSEAMTIQASTGYVGIGATAPNGNFEVAATLAGTPSFLYLTNNTTAGNGVGEELAFSGGGIRQAAIRGVWDASGTTTGYLSFVVRKSNALTEALRLDSSANTNLVGSVVKYNNITTAGWGVPAIYGYTRPAQQVNALVTLATYTVGAADGSFMVSGNINVTVATASLIGMTCTYTDESNTSRTLVLNFSNIAGVFATTTTLNTAGAFEGVPVHIRAKAATSITLATTGTVTTATYTAEGQITQIA